MKTIVVFYLAIAFLMLSALALPAFSQSGSTLSISAAPSPAAVVKVDATQPAFFDKVLAALKSAGGIVSGFLILFEVVLKMLPTVKPLSILLPVKYVVDSLSAILFWVSNSLLIPMINLANKSDEKLKPESWS